MLPKCHVNVNVHLLLLVLVPDRRLRQNGLQGLHILSLLYPRPDLRLSHAPAPSSASYSSPDLNASIVIFEVVLVEGVDVDLAEGV